MKTTLACLTAIAIHTVAAYAGETVLKDSQGMDCFVYTPDPIVPETTYQLVVGVHGAGGRGNGAAGMMHWAKRGDVIVIGPSFVSRGESPYQNGNGIHAEKLIALVENLKKDYKLRDKMFLHGFSGGSQFVHRFTMLHPELVCGVSAHSGGTWATDNYGQINPSAKKIPFAISCGEKDTGKAFPESPYTRMEWFGRFRDEIDTKRFTYLAATWPDVGHSISPGAWDLAKQCFQVATGLPGESATQQVTISNEWKNGETTRWNKPDATTSVTSTRTPFVNKVELDKMTQAAFAKAGTEQIPDDRLITFMRKYPPILWKEKPGAEKLLDQCRRAAELWHKAAMANGKWPAAKDEFERFSQGLEINTTD